LIVIKFYLTLIITLLSIYIVAEKWVNSVVSAERHDERVLILKMVLGDCLLNVFMVYAPHSGKPDEEKEIFWNEVFHLVSCIPQNEMVAFAGDMNGHIGSSNVGYVGTHGGFRYGSRNADGSRILEFADGLNFSHLQHIVYEAGSQAGNICGWASEKYS